MIGILVYTNTAQAAILLYFEMCLSILLYLVIRQYNLMKLMIYE